MSPSFSRTESRSNDIASSTSAPVARTQSLPIKAPTRGRSSSNASQISTDDTLSGSVGSKGRVPNWLKHMGQRLSGGSAASPSDRPSSPPMNWPPSDSYDSSDTESAGGSFKESSGFVGRFRRFSRSRDDVPNMDARPPPRRSSVPTVGSAASAAVSARAAAASAGAGSVPGVPAATLSAVSTPLYASTSSLASKNSGSLHSRLPELTNLVKKRVMFAEQVFANDPPQQIPPMHPKKGNVEFKASGELCLSLQDRPRDFDFPPYLERNHGELSCVATQRAHEQANRLHTSLTRTQLSIFNRFSSDPNDHDDDDTVSVPFSHKVDVDGNAHAEHDDDGIASDSSFEQPAQALSPEMIYTRCCHLREILPIKSMIKQLKDQVAPLPSIYVANSKPTMIEILALSDFLAIVPVAWLSLDNTVLTSEMLRLILVALSHTRHLAKLNLQNTQLDELGWKYLCLFYANNETLLSLDVSCDPSKSRVPTFNRRDMDWGLLGRALAVRKAFIHLGVSGCQISSKDLRKILANHRKGSMLELARNNFERGDLEMVVDWLEDPDTLCDAVNLSGNDFSQSFDLVTRLAHMKRIARLILADTNLTPPPHIDGGFLDFEIAHKSRLRYLDLSGNPALFPGFLGDLVYVLPHLKHLVRLDLARCNLSSEYIVSLCEAIVNCTQLGHLNVLENPALTETAAASLAVAVRMSRTLCTVEVDTSTWSDDVRKQIAKYSLQNLESATSLSLKDDQEDSAQLRSFRRDLATLSAELDKVGSSEAAVKSGTAEKLMILRKKLRLLLQDLLRRKAEKPLTMAEREDLIRLYFYDNQLDRIFRQLCSVSQPAPPMEEAISAFDESKPVLSRRSSTTSIRSLRQQELEEGETHKLNTYLMGYLYNNKDTDNNEKAELFDLWQQEEDKSPEALDRLVKKIQKLRAADLEKLIN